jgi:hypothetical protein
MDRVEACLDDISRRFDEVLQAGDVDDPAGFLGRACVDDVRRRVALPEFAPLCRAVALAIAADEFNDRRAAANAPRGQRLRTELQCLFQGYLDLVPSPLCRLRTLSTGRRAVLNVARDTNVFQIVHPQQLLAHFNRSCFRNADPVDGSTADAARKVASWVFWGLLTPADRARIAPEAFQAAYVAMAADGQLERDNLTVRALRWGAPTPATDVQTTREVLQRLRIAEDVLRAAQAVVAQWCYDVLSVAVQDELERSKGATLAQLRDECAQRLRGLQRTPA